MNSKEKFDFDEYYEKRIEPYLESKGVQKMWNYFIDITKTDYFKKTIKSLKIKYEIPSDGFPSNPDGSYISPPQNFHKSKELRKDIIEKICKKYRLHYFDYSDVLLDYILHNHLNPLNELGSCGLFHVYDVPTEKEEYEKGSLFEESDDIAYPIAIRISPYATQNDLKDFIGNKVIWKEEIGFLQNKYKVLGIKIGKVRKKKIPTQKRNDFIYDNRHLPRKEIMKLVHSKFGEVLDPGHIGKIASLEKKSRENK